MIMNISLPLKLEFKNMKLNGGDFLNLIWGKRKCTRKMKKNKENYNHGPKITKLFSAFIIISYRCKGLKT